MGMHIRCPIWRLLGSTPGLPSNGFDCCAKTRLPMKNVSCSNYYTTLPGGHVGAGPTVGIHITDLSADY